MRRFMLSLFLSVAVLVPNLCIAQVYQFETPPPQVTAAGANWQVSGRPIFFAGNFYYPAGPTVFFDGNVMVRSGVYEGVPLYTDTTVEPYSMVFVPVGGTLMRPYERLRAGELAGTIGSRTPSFPTERDVELSLASGRYGFTTPVSGDSIAYAESQRMIGTGGLMLCCMQPPAAQTAAPAPPAAYAPTAIQSIPPPAGATNGVWIEFEGSRWYSDGNSVGYDANRFVPAGNYRGFPVYRDRAANDRIFVTVVPDGPVAPFVRR